jgi:hypothetical protein
MSNKRYVAVGGEDATRDFGTTVPSAVQPPRSLEAFTFATGLLPSDSVRYVYRFPAYMDILRNAELNPPGANMGSTLQYVRQLVSAMQSLMQKNRYAIQSSAILPPLQFRWIDDGSALVEWLFKDFRIGFSIEPQVKESGWYLVSNENLGEISASGPLDFANLDPLLLQLLFFALSHS